MTRRARLAALPLATALAVAAGAAPQTEPAAPARGEAVAAVPALPPPAPRAERWRYNPRERTARGLDAWEEGRFAEADAAFARALALAPGAGDVEALDPLTLLNAGTGRLAAGAPQDAAGLLAAAAERAREGADPDLEAAARYNLGNARYAGGDFAAAAEAYRAVLRQEPAYAPAKHNLELALRRLAEQRQAQAGDGTGEQRPDQPGGEDGEGEQTGEGEGEGEPSAEPPENSGAPQQQPDRPPDPGTAPQPQPGDETGDDAGDRRDRPLPGFEDQPDMTAEQAAAILEAVESLERQRRRAAAQERARRTAGGRDW